MAHSTSQHCRLNDDVKASDDASTLHAQLHDEDENLAQCRDVTPPFTAMLKQLRVV